MGPVEIAATFGASLFIGGLIGGLGIGGVLLVPFLTMVIGLGVREAVAIAMASYMATGLVAILQARFAGDGQRLFAYWPLIVATLPGAFLGGLAVAVLPETATLLVLAAFLVITGLWTLLRDRLVLAAGPALQPGWATGLGSGFASAVTGTGGPAVLIPILLWCRVPLLAAIAIGQIVQLPIALAATIGNLTAGPFSLATTLLVAAGLTPGVVLGRWVATRLPVALLAKIVAMVLIATGLLLAVRTI